MGKLFQPESGIKQRCKRIVWWIRVKTGSQKKINVFYTAAGLGQSHGRRRRLRTSVDKRRVEERNFRGGRDIESDPAE